MIEIEQYGFDVSWSEEDGGYIATCPDFHGLSTFGESEELALSEGKEALRLFLESLQTEGKLAPRATTVQKFRRLVSRSKARRAAAA